MKEISFRSPSQVSEILKLIPGATTSEKIRTAIVYTATSFMKIMPPTYEPLLTKNNKHLRMITIHMPTPIIEILESWVNRGYFVTRSEAIRAAITIGILTMMQTRREEDDG